MSLLPRVLVCALLGSVLLVGESWAESGSGQFQVQALDPNFDVSAMKGPGVQVHSYAEATEPARQLPSPHDEDRLFTEAGVSSMISSWDQADRDLLFLRSRDFTGERLKELYPRLSLKALKKLVTLAQDFQFTQAGSEK
jgi:hypothetical protein